MIFDSEEHRQFILEVLHAPGVMVPVRRSKLAAAVLEAVEHANVVPADRTARLLVRDHDDGPVSTFEEWVADQAAKVETRVALGVGNGGG